MQTPWGMLADLDLTDHEVCHRILSGDKHQLLEGLVVENMFDKITALLPAELAGTTALDAETAIVRDDRAGWLALVWARSRQPGLGRYLKALEKRFGVWLLGISSSASTFLAREHRDGALHGEARPLSELMQQLSGRARGATRVARAVRDEQRQRQSFWGYLSAAYGEGLGKQVVLPRLLLNHGIQPWFRAVWNLDRVFVHGDRVILLEIKHKFPFRADGALRFGLNDGELAVISRLEEAGIDCLHSIVVKPVWDKGTGSMYLLNDLGMRQRAAVIGAMINQNLIDALIADRRRLSEAHTTFTGQGQLGFRSLPVSAFTCVGLLSDPPAQLAAGLSRVIRGQSGPAAKDDWLVSLRVKG